MPVEFKTAHRPRLQFGTFKSPSDTYNKRRSMVPGFVG